MEDLLEFTLFAFDFYKKVIEIIQKDCSSEKQHQQVFRYKEIRLYNFLIICVKDLLKAVQVLRF